jgi:hypothetical protein
MVIIRFLVIAFNVAVVTYLIYRLLQILKEPISISRKAIIVTAGVLLLLTPFSMFFGIMRPTVQYLLIYPIAVSLFLYLVRQVR